MIIIIIKDIISVMVDVIKLSVLDESDLVIVLIL